MSEKITMSEQGYIAAKMLGHITSTKKSLETIIPELSKLIDEDEYNKVMRLLSKWEQTHCDFIELNN